MKALLFALALLSTSAFACFQTDSRKLENRLFIKGMTVNHRLILLNDKNEPYESFGRTLVTDRSGKNERKNTLSFSSGMITINPDQFAKDFVVKIRFLDLKKEILIEVDPNKSATKSLTRSSGACASELKFSKY